MKSKTSNKPALQKAVDWLSMRDYSTKQLADKLGRCEYAQDEIDAALATLHARHYLDDRALCLRQCRNYLSEAKYSILAIRHKLQAKGFGSELIDDSLEQLQTPEYNVQAALRALSLRFVRPQPFEKYGQYLYRKGFSSSDSYAAARRFAAAKNQIDECD